MQDLQPRSYDTLEKLPPASVMRTCNLVLSLLPASLRLATCRHHTDMPYSNSPLPPVPPQTSAAERTCHQIGLVGDILHLRLKHAVQTTASTTYFVELLEFWGLLPGCFTSLVFTNNHRHGALDNVRHEEVVRLLVEQVPTCDTDTPTVCVPARMDMRS